MRVEQNILKYIQVCALVKLNSSPSPVLICFQSVIFLAGKKAMAEGLDSAVTSASSALFCLSAMLWRVNSALLITSPSMTSPLLLLLSKGMWMG